MRNLRPLLGITVALLVIAGAQAQTFTTLYNFTGGTDGGNPEAGVIQDSADNLYGTTYRGGILSCAPSLGCGVVFKVNTAGVESVLHAFSGYPSDGSFPYAAPLARDQAGNLYGVTTAGGNSSNCVGGCGVVFKIDTAGNETVLYSFTGGADGCVPAQGLVVAASGALYGTANQCGNSKYGTIFKVDSTGHFTLLHSFTGPPSDGGFPLFGHLATDKSGNLYGVTDEGGANNAGLVYKLDKSGTLTPLYSFAGGTSDGCQAYGSVLLDEAGNLYGATTRCGSSSNHGIVWKVSTTGKEKTVHSFTGGDSDGCIPLGGVVRDPNGILSGVTSLCGENSEGILYEWSAKNGFAVLHSFGSDGAVPLGEVLRTPSGTLFGTTSSGGTSNFGTVWRYVP